MSTIKLQYNTGSFKKMPSNEKLDPIPSNSNGLFIFFGNLKYKVYCFYSTMTEHTFFLLNNFLLRK
jgi:hypothetical protein